jgi:hypothetical protein
MRGQNTQQAGMFSYLSPEEQVPVTHPLRPIRQYVDTALTTLLPQLARLYAHTGRPSITPEKRLRASGFPGRHGGTPPPHGWASITRVDWVSGASVSFNPGFSAAC